MKKTLLLSFTALLAGSTAFGQQFPVPSLQSNEANTTLTRHASPISQPTGEKAMMSVCSDKVTYVDNNGTGDPNWDYAQIGGVAGWDASVQSFPNFTGIVTRVDIKAQSFSGTGTVQASIHAINASNEPIGAPIASGNISVSAGLGEYGVNLASPANVTNGFAVVIWDLEAGDSIKVMLNSDGSGGWTGYSFLMSGGALSNIANDFGVDSDHLFRPTIQFNTRSVTLTANPASACAGQSVGFSYVYGATPGHYNSTIYNPAGVSTSLTYGDGSPNGTSMPASHTYSLTGSMNASLIETYIGWTSNCASDPGTQTVVITPGTSALFGWASTGLQVNFTDMCTNATGYSWLFGDAGTSGAPSPVHNYASSGTYTVELTATGPCGSDYYTTNITITDTTNGGNVGINDLSEEFHLGIYPNPTDGNFTLSVETADADDMIVEVVSTVGEILFRQEFNSISQLDLPLDMTNVAGGVYFVHIKHGEKDITKPLVIK